MSASTQQKTILAIPGSLREGSTNHNILKYIGTLIPAGVDYQIYGELAYIPPFDPGLDNDTPPASIAVLRERLANASAVIICTPEYAYGVPGQLKNALDWMVSSGSFIDKPVALITASLGGEACHAAMQLILGAINSKLIPEATLLIQFIRSKMDGEGNIRDGETRESVDSVVKNFLENLS